MNRSRFSCSYFDVFMLGFSSSFSLVFFGSSSMAMISDFSLLFSPFVIKFLQKEDLPVPVSPTTKMLDPSGKPPFKFLSNSLLPVGQIFVSRETILVLLGVSAFFA